MTVSGLTNKMLMLREFKMFYKDKFDNSKNFYAGKYGIPYYIKVPIANFVRVYQLKPAKWVPVPYWKY